MTIVESVKDFILTCPLLADLKRLNIDFLPEDPDTYSIEGIPAPEITKTYLDGSTERQFVFVFAARMFYSEEVRNNIENSGFYEKFAEWLEEQTEAENLPVLTGKKTASKIEAMSSGYLYDIAGDLTNARYQIQCRLIYDKEK